MAKRSPRHRRGAVYSTSSHKVIRPPSHKGVAYQPTPLSIYNGRWAVDHQLFCRMTKLLSIFLLFLVSGAMIACNKDKETKRHHTNDTVLSVDDDQLIESVDDDQHNESEENYQHNEKESYRPEAHEIQEPVQEWINCTGCMGTGQCPYCYGQGRQLCTMGINYGEYIDCPVCTDGRCSICAGRGGHNETRYVTKTVYY